MSECDKIVEQAWKALPLAEEHVNPTLLARRAVAATAKRCAEIANEQEQHWREEKRKSGNYRVMGAISECRRVGEAILAAFPDEVTAK